MKQNDWVSGVPEDKPFVDRRPTRPVFAEKKAVLALELGRLINRAPASIGCASVNRVREWKTAREAAAKVAGNVRSSVVMLEIAIQNMRRFEEPSE